MTLTTEAAVLPRVEPEGVDVRAQPADGPRPRPDHRSLVLALIVMGILAVGLVASAWPRATMSFGDSHDGRNAGMWAERSRSLRENGPIASRLGTRSLVGGETLPYANHPPLIATEAALAEAVLGERSWVTRLPAWAGSLASLVLAFFLLRACRLRPLAAAIGVALGFGCPLFATYGTVLDTTMVSLPFGIAVLWLWQRGRTGRSAHPVVLALVSALAALTSWLGLLTAVLVAGATLAPRVRRRLARADRPLGAADQCSGSATGFVTGAVAGASLVLLWIAWAYGSLQPLIDQFLLRTGEGGETVGLDTFVFATRMYWPQVFTPWQLLLAIPALVAAVRWRPTRPVACVLLVGLAVWVGGLRSGAVHHDYWAYWMVVPLALGLGVMAEVGLAAIQERQKVASGPAGSTAGPRRTRRRSLGTISLAGCAAGLGLVGAVGPSPSGAFAAEGAAGGAALRAAVYPPGQQRAWYLGDIIPPVDWIAYNSRRPAVELGTPADVSRLAATAPDELVLVHGGRLRPDARSPGPNPGCRAGVPEGRRFAVLTAAALSANLARPAAACPA